jgi:F-type H+-transporting ATPase subunit b
MRRSAFVLAGVAGCVAVAAPAHAGGMPQLDFGNKLLLSQVVWGAIIFALFYVGVSRYGLPRVDSILAMRAAVIGGDLEQARLSKQRADQAVAELNEARRLAYAESQAAVNAATQKAKDEAAAQAAEANARLDRQLAESEAQIGAARDRAMASLRDVAVDTADAIIERLTNRQPDLGRVRDAVDRGLRARGLDAGSAVA